MDLALLVSNHMGDGQELGIVENFEGKSGSGCGSSVGLFQPDGNLFHISIAAKLVQHHGVALVNDLIKPGVVGLQNGWWEQQGGSSSHVTNDKWKTLGGTHCCNQTLVDVKKEA